MSYGFVYCLEHHLMPGLYKIGHTYQSPHQRAVELARATGVPECFTVTGYLEIDLPHRWEERFHRFLDEYRQNPRREFFRCGLETIAPLFLRNEYACAVVDCNFTPGMYPHELGSLPNPYLEHQWLASEP